MLKLALSLAATLCAGQYDVTVRREQVLAYGDGGVAMDDFELLVGAPAEGVVYWYTGVNHNDTRDFALRQEPVGTMVPDDDSENATKIMFGAAVAMSRTYSAVGAPLANGGRGAVYVFGIHFRGTPSFKLTPPDDDVFKFGFSLSASFGRNEILVVGAPGGTNGSAYAYELTGAREPELEATFRGASSNFGYAVSAKARDYNRDATAVVVSDGNDVFVYSDARYRGFELTQVLHAPEGVDDDDDFFGEALSLSQKSPFLAVQDRAGTTYAYRTYDAGAHWSSPLQALSVAGRGRGVEFMGYSDDYLLTVGANDARTTTNVYVRDDWSLFHSFEEETTSPPPRAAVAATALDFVVGSVAYAFVTCDELSVESVVVSASGSNGPSNGSYALEALAFAYIDNFYFGSGALTRGFWTPRPVATGQTGLALSEPLCLRDGCYSLTVENASSYHTRYGSWNVLRGNPGPFWVKEGAIVRTNEDCDNDFLNLPGPTAFPTVAHTPAPVVDRGGKKKKSSGGLSTGAFAAVVVAAAFAALLAGCALYAKKTKKDRAVASSSQEDAVEVVSMK